MVAVIAKMNVREGASEEFERLFAALAERVRSNEPETRLYQLTRSRSEPNSYRVMELYASDDALQKHMDSAHLAEFLPLIGKCLASRPEIDRCDVLNGASE